ncbi:MAG: biopolymer transporter ExbD, partial [Proteobacteria bacterium]
MNFRRGMAREEPEINLIAFIDVLLVILIFLMVTTTYSRFT